MEWHRCRAVQNRCPPEALLLASRKMALQGKIYRWSLKREKKESSYVLNFVRLLPAKAPPSRSTHMNTAAKSSWLNPPCCILWLVMACQEHDTGRNPDTCPKHHTCRISHTCRKHVTLFPFQPWCLQSALFFRMLFGKSKRIQTGEPFPACLGDA